MQKREEDSTRKGVDSFFTFPYMGSTEFEFGALPKSLVAIRKKKNWYTMDTIPNIKSHDGLSLYLYCDAEKRSGIEKEVVHLSKSRYNDTKEMVYLHERLYEPKHLGTSDFCGWWAIDEHWVLILGRKNSDNFLQGVLDG